jgi:hypothetical protein
VPGRLVRLASRELLARLRRLQRAERPQQPRIHRQHPEAVPRLGLLLEHLALDEHPCPPDRQHPTVQVDVGPAKAQDLTAPQAVQGQPPRGEAMFV